LKKKKNDTSEYKSINFGFVTIGFIIFTSICAKRMAKNGQELFLKVKKRGDRDGQSYFKK
jgi:hypothetical protein